MNKDACVSMLHAMEIFQSKEKQYEQFLEKVRNAERPLSALMFSEVLEQAKKRKEDLEEYKKEFDKFKDFLHPTAYQSFLVPLESEITVSNMMLDEVNGFFETQDPHHETNLFDSIDLEKQTTIQFKASMMNFERNISIMVVGAVLNGKMSLEEVKDLAASLEKGSKFQQLMLELITDMERKNHAELNPVEPDKDKDKDTGAAPATAEPADKKEPEKKELTLAEKIAQVNYSETGNMVAEVQNLTVEDRMKEIATLLAKYSEKEKLTLRDMIEIASLQEEQVELEAYLKSLNDQKLSRSETRRNKGIEKATAKIEESKNLIRQSKKNEAVYNSKIMRFFSAKYQERLAQRILDLREKRGTLQREQRESAVAKFNKNSGKISRRSRVLGTTRALSDFANIKLNELRTLREQVIAEASNFREDFDRFVSRRERISEMQERPVIVLDEVRELESEELNHAKAA